MTQLHGGDSRLRGFLFSPASSYPIPTAYVIDDVGTILHWWSHSAHQPELKDNPPNYLRGWNHVEVDACGNLYAIVPLRSLLKLTPESELEWSCDVAAHHDLAIDDDGNILVLSEAPRRAVVDDCTHVFLDNLITIVDRSGMVKAEYSLYDVLRTSDGLRELIDDSVKRRNEEFRIRGWPAGDESVPHAVAQETQALLRTATYEGELRRALQRLRDLPGSPCDVLHANTVELLPAHPQGIWHHGDVMLCMRELNAIAVVDLPHAEVRWWWGPGELSGPHQPSMLSDGTVLVFDNGIDKRRTRLVTVDPSTRGVVWCWSPDPSGSFFCPRAGGCEGLANGNLLITNSTAGGAFELAPDGQVVWQLTLPVDVYGLERGRVSIYRMSAVDPDVVARFPAKTRTGRSRLRTETGSGS